MLICHRLRDIDRGIAHDCNLEIVEVDKVKINVSMPMERPNATFYLLTIAMFALSVTSCKESAIEICMTLTLTFSMGQCQI